jgi:hypothetical protein
LNTGTQGHRDTEGTLLVCVKCDVPGQQQFDALLVFCSFVLYSFLSLFCALRFAL